MLICADRQVETKDSLDCVTLWTYVIVRGRNRRDVAGKEVVGYKVKQGRMGHNQLFCRASSLPRDEAEEMTHSLDSVLDVGHTGVEADVASHQRHGAASKD